MQTGSTVKAAQRGDLVVEPLSDRILSEVVDLHRRELDYTLNSRLGPKHLGFVYRVMMRHPASLVRVALLNGKVTGVVSATLDPASLKSAIMSEMTFSQRLALCRELLIKPGLLFAFLTSLKVERPVSWDGDVVTPVLTTMAVDRETRMMGIGRKLVGYVDHFMIEQGKAVYRLDTRSESARLFYQRVGFVEVEKRRRDTILVKPLGGEHVR